MAESYKTSMEIRPRAKARVVFTPKNPAESPRTGWFDAERECFRETDGRAWRWHEVTSWTAIERDYVSRAQQAASTRWVAY